MSYRFGAWEQKNFRFDERRLALVRHVLPPLREASHERFIIRRIEGAIGDYLGASDKYPDGPPPPRAKQVDALERFAAAVRLIRTLDVPFDETLQRIGYGLFEEGPLEHDEEFRSAFEAAELWPDQRATWLRDRFPDWHHRLLALERAATDALERYAGENLRGRPPMRQVEDLAHALGAIFRDYARFTALDLKGDKSMCVEFVRGVLGVVERVTDENGFLRLAREVQAAIARDLGLGSDQ